MRLVREKPRYGYRRLQVLVEREGERVNNKRLWRVYCEAGFCPKRKKSIHCVRVGSPRQELTEAEDDLRGLAWNKLDAIHPTSHAPEQQMERGTTGNSAD